MDPRPVLHDLGAAPALHDPKFPHAPLRVDCRFAAIGVVLHDQVIPTRRS